MTLELEKELENSPLGTEIIIATCTGNIDLVTSKMMEC